MTTEYEVSSVDDSEANVNAHMREMAELGWELVSGSACTLAVSEANDRVWKTRYVMYWKRP